MFACINTSMLNITYTNDLIIHRLGSSFTEGKSSTTTLWILQDYLELRSFIREEIDSKRHCLLDVAGLGLSGVFSASDLKSRENLPSLAYCQARKVEIDLAESGEPTWPDLVLSLQGKDRLSSRF